MGAVMTSLDYEAEKGAFLESFDSSRVTLDGAQR
jgi:hypothetical protein